MTVEELRVLRVRMEVTEEVAKLLQRAVQDGWSLREFGEAYIEQFCRPTLGQVASAVGREELRVHG